MKLIERVVTTKKVFELQWKEEGYLQIRDNMGAFGNIGLISKEGVTWVDDNFVSFGERLWGGNRMQPEERVRLTH